MKEESNLTILIPTLGKGISKKWIKQINNYSEHGFKVILCIPPNINKKKICELGFNTLVKVINSQSKGQVNQRQFGLKFCETEYIAYMDDDIIFDKNDLKDLFSTYQKLKTKVVIAPIIKDEKHNSKSNYLLRKFKNLFLYSSFNPTPGTISDTSFPVPHNLNKYDPKIFNKEVDWLPGGLIFFKKDYVILDSYFPFKGKAYCEDLIHSYILKSRGIKLIIYYNYKCYTEIDSYRNLSFKKFFSYIKNDYKIRKYFNRLHDGDPNKLYLAYIFLILVFILNKFFSFRKLFFYN